MGIMNDKKTVYINPELPTVQPRQYLSKKKFVWSLPN